MQVPTSLKILAYPRSQRDRLPQASPIIHHRNFKLRRSSLWFNSTSTTITSNRSQTHSSTRCRDSLIQIVKNAWLKAVSQIRPPYRLSGEWERVSKALAMMQGSINKCQKQSLIFNLSSIRTSSQDSHNSAMTLIKASSKTLCRKSLCRRSSHRKTSCSAKRDSVPLYSSKNKMRVARATTAQASLSTTWME